VKTIHVINLARTPGRLEDFLTLNSHLREVVRFPAVDGASLNLAMLVASGVIDPRLAVSYSPGAIGNALSHLSLWSKSINSGEIVTVCEDDAILNHYFAKAAEIVIAKLPAEWDFVAWGWNFDSYLTVDLLPGVTPSVFFCDQEKMRASTEIFQRTVFTAHPLRLLRAFGMHSYSISPKGARAFMELCLPIRPMQVYFPGLNRKVPNSSFDVMASNAYPKTLSFVSVPPLAISKNEHEKSTVTKLVN
jgi:GR25 family glycosyltransferase involved in LPS biosynthesis